MRYFIPVLLVFFACNPSRKIEKAEQIVRLSPASFNKIGKEWNALNPCANDTVGYWYSGGVDSIPYPVPVFDSVAYNHAMDSILLDCKRAYELGYENATNKLASQKIAVKRPDTVVKVIVDRQKLKLQDDSIQSLNVKYSYLSGQADNLNEALKKQSQKTTGWIWWFVLAVVALIVSNLLWLYSKISIK
ncbi:MAG: hypothetical protein WCH59_09375 [Chitinophagia bacterium]|jgi:hypothetical protein